MPKFSHVPMAVIHPSPKKRRPSHRRTAVDLELVADAARQHVRVDPRREIPESLTRPPAEFNRRRPKSACFKPQGKGFGGAGLGGSKRSGSVRD